MNSLNDSTIERLISLEAHVHYGEPPPPDVQPFLAFKRDSSVLISAPHGSRTFRDDGHETWHEEDEYTAAIALLLSECCGTSVIANVWRSDLCDPNAHNEKRCLYKQQLREIVRQQGVRWVLDLHGAAEISLGSTTKIVDLGTRKEKCSMATQHRDKLQGLIEARLGSGCVSLDVFAASSTERITGFCQDELKIEAIQIEMKPSVRVPLRRVDASSYSKLGPFSASPRRVMDMLAALEKFINYLRGLEPTPHSK
jgi:hypothetical protein